MIWFCHLFEFSSDELFLLTKRRERNIDLERWFNCHIFFTHISEIATFKLHVLFLLGSIFFLTVIFSWNYFVLIFFFFRFLLVHRKLVLHTWGWQKGFNHFYRCLACWHACVASLQNQIHCWSDLSILFIVLVRFHKCQALSKMFALGCHSLKPFIPWYPLLSVTLLTTGNYCQFFSTFMFFWGS